MAQSRRQFVTGGDMRTPVIFYTAHTTDDFMPGETTVEYYRCFADVYPPSIKDLERDNEASITMVTWHPQNDKSITTEMYFEIALPQYEGKQYNIINVEGDTNNHYNIKIIGKRKS